MDALDAVQAQVIANHPELEGAVLTRCVLLVEMVLPAGGRAFQRMAVTADGSPMVSWEIDGFLVKGLRQTRPDATL